MTTTTAEVETTVRELIDIMGDVTASFSIWKELTDVQNQAAYEDTKDRYEEFFLTVDRANLAMVINGLHMLLEDKSNTHNLQSALKKQRTLGQQYEHQVDAWLSEISSWSSSIKKIIKLRSNIFAHRGGKATAAEFMRQAEITPDEIGLLIEKLNTLLSAFTELALPSIYVPSIAVDAGATTKQLMRSLLATKE